MLQKTLTGRKTGVCRWFLLRTAGINPPALQADALAACFKSRPAQFWQDLLTPAEVGCLRADGPLPSRFWLADAQAQALDLTSATEHPTWGPYRRHGAMVRFDGQAAALDGPPLAGQHNTELLLEAGFSIEQIERMAADRVTWSEST